MDDVCLSYSRCLVNDGHAAVDVVAVEGTREPGVSQAVKDRHMQGTEWAKAQRCEQGPTTSLAPDPALSGLDINISLQAALPVSLLPPQGPHI